MDCIWLRCMTRKKKCRKTQVFLHGMGRFISFRVDNLSLKPLVIYQEHLSHQPSPSLHPSLFLFLKFTVFSSSFLPLSAHERNMKHEITFYNYIFYNATHMTTMFLDPDVTRYLHVKAMTGDHNTVSKLLSMDPQEVHSTYGRLTVPPIFYSCRCGHLDVCLVLLHFGASINEQVQGWTPLFEACKGNHMKVVTWLLDNDVDPSASLRFSRMNPLMHVVRRGLLIVCKKLVERGRIPFIKAIIFKPPSSHAPKSKQRESAQIQERR